MKEARRKDTSVSERRDSREREEQAQSRGSRGGQGEGALVYNGVGWCGALWAIARTLVLLLVTQVALVGLTEGGYRSLL